MCVSLLFRSEAVKLVPHYVNWLVDSGFFLLDLHRVVRWPVYLIFLSFRTHVPNWETRGSMLAGSIYLFCARVVH